jgi:hypothetical protein
MLYISSVLSLVLLGIALWAVRRTEHPVLIITVAGAGLTVIPVMFLMTLFPAVGMQALLLAIAAIVWSVCRGRSSSFVLAACGATVVAYGIEGCLAFREYSRLCEQFAYASMEERLPAKAAAPKRTLPPATVKRLDSLESNLAADATSASFYQKFRTHALERLHEDAVGFFIGQPGFGMGRMRSMFSERALRRGLRTEPTPPQPGTRLPVASLATSFAATAADPAEHGSDELLDQMHQCGVIDFVYPVGFGFFKDRRHVAGFEPHQFSQVPTAEPPWRLQTLDLLGLVVHEEPTVYVSATLPRMDELGSVPTRPPDQFEAAGLRALRSGEDLFVREAGDCRRMVGAIRSTRQCLSCHSGNRGDLLGAFSYVFTRSER